MYKIDRRGGLGGGAKNRILGQTRKLLYWIPLIPIAKSLHPTWTLLIFFLILSFGNPCWIPTNRSFSLTDVNCWVSKIDTLIGCILDTFLDIILM